YNCPLSLHDVLPIYLLALALAVNAGSVATVTGNPQNVLVAVAADIDYVRFAARLAPVALASLAVVFLVVLLLHWRDLAAAPPPADRKSTRLNSSHVK